MSDNTENVNNLKQGLINIKSQLENIKEFNLDRLLEIYSQLGILMYRSFNSNITNIAYECQDIQYSIKKQILSGTI